jgi:hypothetical protein
MVAKYVFLYPMIFQEFLPPILLLMAILWLIGRLPYFSIAGVAPKWLQIAFLIKVLAGIGMFYLYTYYYPVRTDADTFKYFDDSRSMYDALWTKPVDFFKMLFGVGCENDYFFKTYYVKMNNWYLAYDNGLINDSRLIIRLNAIFRIFSFGNYHIHNLLLNLISFIGLYSLMRLFIEVTASKWKSYVAAFLVPSAIFWSSGILKEAVLIFAIGLFCWNFYRLVNGTYRWKTLLTILVLLPLLLVVKLYVFTALITASIGLLLTSRWKRTGLCYIVSCLGFFMVVFIIGLIAPTYSFVELLVQKQHDFVELAQRASAGSFIETSKLNHTFGSILFNFPVGLFNTLTRPWPTDIHGILFIPAFIENLIIVMLILLAILKPIELEKNQKSFIWFAATFTIILFSIIGITTPIIGAIVRYKIPALPFLFILLLSAIRSKKVDNRVEPLLLLKVQE